MATIADIGYTTDYVANGSFAALKENVTYRDTPDYARLVRLKDYRNDWDTNDAVYVDESSFRFLKKSVLYPGDIIIANVGAYAGTVFRVPDLDIPMTLGPNAVLLRVVEDNDADYVFQHLSSSSGWGLLRSIVSGSAQPKFNKTDLRALNVPLPPLQTQRKIAAILSAYDDLIKNNDRRVKLLEEMAQRIYREWFVDFQYPGHENVQLVASELGPIPEGWVVGTLGGVCSRITDGAHHSPVTTTIGMPMASVKDMTPRSLDISTCRLISKEDYDSLVRQDCRPRAHDVLVSKDGANFLKHVFPMFADSVAVLLSSVAVLRPSEAISPVVLALTLREPTNKAQLKNYVSGAAIPRVVLKDFMQYRLVLPPRLIQERFDEVCQPLMRQAVTLESLNRQLRATRDLLLPRLISGEVDVTDLHIAMAEDTP